MIDDATPPEQLKRMQAMIRNFCRLEDGKMLREVSLRQYGRDSGETITNATVQELCAIHPDFLSLDMTGCSEVSDVGLWSIARHCRDLQKLTLSGCDKITNVGVRSLSLRCFKLVELILDHCPLLDDVTLTVIAAGSWKIQKISLRECVKITDSGLSKLAQLGKCLRIVDLSGCINVGEYGDRALKEIGACCSELRELYITNSRRVEDTGLIAIANGCLALEVLEVNGCDNITKKAFKKICQNLRLHTLRIAGCKRLSDEDLLHLSNNTITETLISVSFVAFKKITDRGIAAVCQAVGHQLRLLNFSYNHSITDFCSIIIGNMCPSLRSLDLSHCPNITNETVHQISKKISVLTNLKLDGDPKITISALLSHVGKELEFVEMATGWLGFRPKGNAEKLIEEKLNLLKETAKAIKIQCLIRKKFANKIFWARHRDRMIATFIPIFQAVVRGYFQRKRFAVLKYHLLLIRMAIKIQTCYRKYYALHSRIKTIKRNKFNDYKNHLAQIIQRLYRGFKGRQMVKQIRIIQVNREHCRMVTHVKYCVLFFSSFVLLVVDTNFHNL